VSLLCTRLLRFTEYAIKEVEKAREAGKPIYPMLTALRYKAEPLMACKVRRVLSLCMWMGG
jgi:hypothetical protein